MIEEKVRLMLTAIVIAEYSLIQMGDNVEEGLKEKVYEAIEASRKVQGWFINHPNSTQETSEIFKEQFLSEEMILLSELLNVCSGISAEGLEEIIKAIKSTQQ